MVGIASGVASSMALLLAGSASDRGVTCLSFEGRWRRLPSCTSGYVADIPYVSRRPAHSMYLRLTHKPWASYSHALGLLDWRLVSGFDCVGTLE